MIEWLVIFLQESILPLGVFGVFFASVIEEIIAPIPSAVIMMMSGFIFVPVGFSWASVSALIFKVAIPAALGITIGSYGVFFIAKFGGKFVIEKWGKFIGLYWDDIERLKSRLSGTKKDEIIISAARILPFVPSVAITAFCGTIGMSAYRYFVVTFIGTFFRGLILGAVGWQVGNVYERYADFISRVENFVLVSTILILIIFIMLKYKNRLRNKILN